MNETAYLEYPYVLPELAHNYGPQIHLLADPVLVTQLATLSRPETQQPQITSLVRELYQGLFRYCIASQFSRKNAQVTTRMADLTPNGVWSGQVIDPSRRCVVVDIARAGTVPAQVGFDLLNGILDPAQVRQDHVYMNRVTDDAGAVTGVAVSGNKIGGDVNDAMVMFPDPMGATGGSLSHAIDMYKAIPGGKPRAIAALHLIVTPEYLSRLQADHPDVHVYAVRVDRGMSSESILKTPLGTHWEQERGLNETQYIVPGAGGLGEILNNAFV